MNNIFKEILRSKYILGLFFVVLGFGGASFVFKILTTNKQLSLTSLSAQSRQEIPIPQSNEIAKSTKIPSTSLPPDTINIPKDTSQAILKEFSNKEVLKKEAPVLVLTGITITKTGNLALINDRIVKEGDSISGVRVISISSNRVELDNDGEKIILRIK